MKLTRLVLTFFAITAAMAMSVQAATDEQPESQDTAAVVAQDTTSSPTQAMPGMAGMKDQMKAMHEMHGKMMAAKTPEERNALMDENRKMMQDSMTMMNRMGGREMPEMQDDLAARQKMMEQRMDMMQSMMQMMMDRAAPTAAEM